MNIGLDLMVIRCSLVDTDQHTFNIVPETRIDVVSQRTQTVVLGTEPFLFLAPQDNGL